MTLPRRRFPPSLRSLRVALIEDDPDVRAVLSSLLELWGHEVVGEAASGRQGARLLEERRPDAAIIDIGLPELDGNAVAEQARSTLGDECPRLIALTGFADLGEVNEEVFDVTLRKPPDPGALAAALRGIDDESPGENR